MICYFSGTGNSRYLALRLGDGLQESVQSLNDKIKARDTSPFPCSRLIFVTPTYAWRMPRVVEKWIRETEFPQNIKVWFVMDCGSEIGDAGSWLRRLCTEKCWDYQGVFSIVMPENYIAMFHTPGADQARGIIEKAMPALENCIHLLRDGKPFPKPRRNLYDRFMSNAVNPLFYRFVVKAKAFHTLDSCIGCEKCVRLCPLNNIRMRDGKPVWGSDCTHCMACICCCPAEAIEYGGRSVGKPRYHLDDERRTSI